MKKLSHTNIEYILNPDGTPGYAWNIYPGCLHRQQGICPVPQCWAEGMWKRIQAASAKRGIILPDFDQPHLVPELLLAPLSVRKPSTFAVNFMGDLSGDWVDPFGSYAGVNGYVILADAIFRTIVQSPQHRFLFLGKNPANWQKWNPWPDNAYVGATVCNEDMLIDAVDALNDVDAAHKWLSVEPLMSNLRPFHLDLNVLQGTKLDLCVIGGLDSGKRS